MARRPAPTTDAPLGTFEEQVLLAVMRTRSGTGAYGMSVRRELEAVTGREVAIGAVYATLDRLEAKGLATSERAESRRAFAITRRGALALSETREMRDRLWSGIDLLPLLRTSSR